jgi:hypothetical protein
MRSDRWLLLLLPTFSPDCTVKHSWLLLCVQMITKGIPQLVTVIPIEEIP